MKKLLIPIILGIVAIVLSIRAFILPLVDFNEVVSGWGDNGGGRQSYTYDEIFRIQANGEWNNRVVFNSISDGEIGNEKNFVGAREYNDAIKIVNANEIDAKDGQEYIIRAYVHNNNPNSYDGLAENVKVAFNVPETSATDIAVHGFIFSDNASPSEYWDGVLFKSDIPFHLEYIYGSALLENSSDSIGKLQLSDEIVTKAASNHGVFIGYDALDGRLPGGRQYACYVSIRVRVIFDTTYTVTQKIRLVGDTEWQSSVDAEVGDQVEFCIEYQNASEEEYHENVMVKDILPENLCYIPGSTKLYNSNHPKGATFDQKSVITTGINIGHYNPGANAFVIFTAEVIDENLQMGSNTLVNWAQVGINGGIPKQDYASVVTFKR